MKRISILAVFFFIFQQIAWAVPDPASIQNPAAAVQPVESWEETSKGVKTSAQIPSALPDAGQFLQQTLMLTSANLEEAPQTGPLDTKPEADKTPPEKFPENSDIGTRNDYAYEEYSFEDALDLFRPEYASAVIVKDLTAEDLKRLAGLTFEAGIAVLEGQLVLFSSGNRDEISANSPALEILEQASFVAHTHPAGAIEGPSGFDDLNAGGGTEYVLTDQGVYAYNRDGLLSSSNDYNECLSALQEAVTAKRNQNSAAVNVRNLLNKFVYEMDELNASDRDDRTTFRSDGKTFTLEAEGMQTSGGTWKGGTFVTLWGNGKASLDYGIAEPGIYEVEIMANSNENGSPALPQMRFSVDGDMAQVPMDVSNNNWQFKSYKWTGIELTAGSHQLEVGAYRSADGQYLAVDKMVIRKTGEIPYPAARAQVEAEGMLTSGGTWKGGTFVTLWGNGKTSLDYGIAEPGIYEVEIMANSNENGSPALPQMRFSVDGDMVQGSTDVSSNNCQFKSYKWTGIELTAGSHQLEVGAYRSADGQYLAVDKMVIRKTGEIAYPAARAQVEAEGMLTSGGTWKGGTFVTLWGNGKTSLDYGIAEPGIYEVEIMANSNENGNPALPQMRFSVDGDMVQGPTDVSNNNWQFKSYKWTGIELTPGSHQLEVGAYHSADGQYLAVDRVILRKISNPSCILIQGGQEYANSLQVDLDLSAISFLPGMTAMRYGWVTSQGTVSYSDWEVFSVHKAVTLPAGNGVKTIRCQVRDQSGNIKTYSDTITLDTTGPNGNISINNGVQYTNSRDVTLTLTGSDTGSGLGQMRFSIDNGGSWTAWEDFKTEKPLTLSAGDGTKNVLCQIWDKAWNLSTFLSSVVLDTTAPNVMIDPATPHLIGSRNLTVHYTADAAAKTKEFKDLKEGDNTLTITETDAAGNRTSVNWTVTVDSLAPNLYLISSAYVYQPDYVLQYRVSDASMAASTLTENITLKQGQNTITREATDPFGHSRQMTWKIYLDENAERGKHYDYDGNGNVTRETTLNGEDIYYEYDADNRLAKVTSLDGKAVRYAYTVTGQMASMEEERGVSQYSYDISGRLSSVVFPDGNSIRYDWNLSGQLVKLRYVGRTVEYGYDETGRLIRVADGDNITAYAYNAAGDLISTALPNGIRTSYEYDQSARLTKVRHEKAINGGLIEEFDYTLDAAGQRTQMIVTQPGNVRTVNYTYDLFGRLTEENDSATGTTKYSYDAAGNRLTKEFIPLSINSANPRVLTQYSYGADNRLVSLTEKSYDSTGSQISNRDENFVYDAAGNLRQKITPDRVCYYEFNAIGLLTRFNDGQNDTVYEYDGQGSRISKTVNGVKTNYFVDPSSSTPQVLAEFDQAGAVVRSYTLGLDRLSVTSGADTQYFLQDGLGSTVGLTGGDSRIQTPYQYDAFGNRLGIPPNSQGTLPNDFTYAGEQLDPESGLVYLRARYYDPALGRFISRDPVYIGDPSETQSLNPFIYVQNNPVNYLDPLGLLFEWERQIPHPTYGNCGGAAKDCSLGDIQPVDSMDSLFAIHDGALFRTDSVFDPDLYRIERMIADRDLGRGLRQLPQNPLDWPMPPQNVVYTEIYRMFTERAFTDPGKDVTYELERQYFNATKDLKGYDAIGGGFGSGILALDRGGNEPGEMSENDNNRYAGWNPPGGGNGINFNGFFNEGGDGGGIGFNGGIFPSSTDLSVGGVYMDKALEVIGKNIQDIKGVSYDPVTGQIIMLSDTGATVPEIPVDYFLAALKAVFGTSQSAPGVSIDPVRDSQGNIDPAHDQNVNFLGGIEDTALGKAVYDADLLMKLLGMGVDNVTKTNIRSSGEDISEAYVRSHIPDFKDLFTLTSEVSDPSLLNQNLNFRFWFTPKEMKLIQSDAGDAFVFGENSVHLLTEATFYNNGQPVITDDPRATAYAKFFNEHFSELENLYPEFRELEKGMRAVGLAKFIKDNNIPVDLQWLQAAALPSVTTPRTTPVASATKTITHQGTGRQVTLTASGGVNYSLFDGKNFDYVNDADSQAAGLHDAAQSSRTSDTAQSWAVTMNGNTYRASAFSLAPTQKDGNFAWNVTDLSYGTAGEFPLAFQRYYDSFASNSRSNLGYGWDFMPYDLHFPVAKTGRTFGNDPTVYQIPPKIQFADRAEGSVIEFAPWIKQSDGRIIYRSEDQKVGEQILILNADGSYTLLHGGNQINFGAEGALTVLADIHGNTVQYVYDEAKKLIQIVDNVSNRKITITYDAHSRILKVAGPDGRSVSYAYDAIADTLTKVTRDWDGRYVSLSYGSDHNLLTATDDSNRKWFENTYDFWGRLATQKNNLGNQMSYHPNMLIQQTVYTNTTSGAQSQVNYDNRFRPTVQTNALGDQIRFEYGNNLFGITKMTDARGHSQNVEYDSLGNVSSVTDALGNKTKFYYSSTAGESRLLFLQKANGYGTYYEYDSAGHLISVTEGTQLQSVGSDGSVTVHLTNLKTTYVYDSEGRVIQMKDADNHTMNYSYDNTGNVTRVQNGLGDTQSIEYVQRNGTPTRLISKVTDALNRFINYSYDSARDLLTTVTNAAGAVHFSYDSRDRRTEAQDELGRKTQFVYNDKDQWIGTRELGNLGTALDDITASFNYDVLGRITSIAGPMGAVAQFVYDLLGRIKSLTISETAEPFATAQEASIEDIGKDEATLVFNANSRMNSVRVLYKKKSDSAYQELNVSGLTLGENRVRIQGLAHNTNYEFQIEYRDQGNHLSYSRKYEATTQTPEQPVIVRAVVATVGDTAADIKIDVSKAIQSAQIRYHVHGENVNKTFLTRAVDNAAENGITFNLENLRSGLDYDAEIMITDYFGVASQVKNVSFKTTGTLSPEDLAEHAVLRFGQAIRTLSTQAYLSIENPGLSDPFAEKYNLDIRDTQGNPVTSANLSFASGTAWGRIILLSGLSASTQYNYTLTVTSRGDIAPVKGSFRTPTGTDITAPQINGLQVRSKDQVSLLFGITPSEDLKMLEVTLTDNVTQAVKKYYFFNLPGGVAKMFLLDGLESARQYAVKWAMVDMSGNYNAPNITVNTSTMAYDEVPPAIVQSAVTEKTDTTAKLRLITNEILKKLKVHYRIAGTTGWLEQTITPTATTTNEVAFTGLLAGKSYEYQCVFEDANGNQLITEWEGV